MNRKKNLPVDRWRNRNGALILTLVAVLAASLSGVAPPPVKAKGPGGAVTTKPDPADATLLVDSFDELFKKLDFRKIHSFEALLKDPNAQAFGNRVDTRYTEESLTRILASSSDVKARRAAALAAAFSAHFDPSNAAVAKGLRDNDPTVRFFTSKALWAIWFRASSPENNKAIEQVSRLIGEGELDEAIAKATLVIEKAPDFAEAYNQRAIAQYLKGHFAESVEDCRRALARNPYHFGALNGMAGCYQCLDQPRKALSTLRQALRVCPHDESIAQSVHILEQQLGVAQDGIEA
jgi:tetratricopeptide (TPR) repeat protein